MAKSKINRIFSAPDVKYGLSLFTEAEIKVVEKLTIEQNGRFSIKCQIKDKFKMAKPEEVVRQLWIYRLLTEYGYPKERIDVEKVIYFGSRVEPGAADIVIFHEDLRHYYILFETKRPSRTAGLDQLKSYCNAEGAPIGVWSNGNEMIRLHREEPNIFTEIPRIPRISETLRDILTERWTLQWLDEHDELKQGKTTLKKILLDLEELVLGNAGVDPFEEIFKLVYAKLYDEWQGINDSRYQLEFYVGDRSPQQVKRAITNLLDGAKRTWAGIFEPTDKIELKDEHLKVCVSFLEKIKLFNSNLQIIDEAFEYLIPQVSKKKEGQFFTPRAVVDMAVIMLNPKSNEFVVDPACGSAGFLLHSVMSVAGGIISGKPLPPAAQNFAQNNIFGIDFATKAVKISKAINLIVGDGKSHIFKDNSLESRTWTDDTKAGLRPRLLRFSTDNGKDRENQEKFSNFDFDILLTNPPFAGTIKEREILRLYELAEKNGKLVNRVGRHVLFLERSIDFIRPGGRMAIVLPQGLLNNTNAEYIRRFVIDEARILAVVGLHGNTFKPHTGTKTSVLFLQKYTEKERQEIQKIKAKYENGWDKYIKELLKKHEGAKWYKPVDEEKVPEELRAFIESYFETAEEAEDSVEEETNEEATEKKKPLKELIEEIKNLQETFKEKQEELNKASINKQSELRKELKLLNFQIIKLDKGISERTLAGQISLVLNEEKISEAFKKFWLEGYVIKEIDYPIFFAVNQKPVKDQSGDYRYKKDEKGELIIDEHGHPVIDHDLDEIADAFMKFAKKQGFDFWRK